MPKSCYKYVEWEKFKTGFSCTRKAYIQARYRWCKIS